MVKAFEKMCIHLFLPVYPKQAKNVLAIDKISNTCELKTKPVLSRLNPILEKYTQVFTNKLGCFNKGY